MFYSLYKFFYKKKLLFYFFIVFIFGLLAFVARNINFEEDITKLLPSSEKSEKIKEVLSTAKFSDKLIVNIQGNDLEELKSYAQDFDSLTQKNSKEYIQKIQTQVEQDKVMDVMDFVQSNLPLFLDEKDYQHIDSLLQPQQIETRVQESYHSIISPSGWVTTQMIRTDPLGMTFLGLKKLQQFQSMDNFTLEDGYVVSKNKKNLLIFITSRLSTSETDKNSKFIHLLDENIQNLNKKYKGKAEAEYFGAVAAAVANANQIKSDIQLTMSIAFILLFSLYIYFYRRFFVPLVIFVPALFGSLLGVAVLYLLKGTISAVSIGIGSVLLGITLDYSVHILSHYRSSGDIKHLFKDIVSPLLMCAIFTAVDFLCLFLLRSDVLKDLGVFAAVSVMGAALFALVFIPQAYTPKSNVQSVQNTFIDKLSGYDFEKNKYLLVGCFVVILVCLFTYPKVGFNNDLNNLNYVPKNLKTAQDHLNELSNYSSKSVYMVSYGDTYDQALEANHKLYKQLQEKQQQHSILSFSSIGGVVLSKTEQQQKIDRWNQFWTEEKKEKLQGSLISEGKKVGFKDNTFAPFYELLSTEYEPLSEEGYKLFNELFLDDFVTSKKNLTGITTILKTNQENTQNLINDISKNNKNVLVIDRKNLQENILGNLEEDFNNLFWISTIVVFLAVFIYFGSMEITLLTNIPIFIGWFVTLGIMGIFGVDFNAFNIIITTLIFGLGIDYSIFISKALLEEYTYGKSQMKTYKSGVIMSALTTILCFGVLIFSKHPAIKSIAIIPLIGLLAVVIISFTIQPWLFNLMLMNPQKKGYTPFRLFNFITAIIGFGYFLISALLLNIFAFTIFPLIPVKKSVKVRYLHTTFRYAFRFLILFFPRVRVKQIGYSRKLYDEPSIIIANHTSELDTIVLGMMDSRQIFMINNRIYHSKFFGKAIRIVDYFPSMHDLDEGLEKLRRKIEQGYSLIIFPEGTRSENSRIHRFHKGAFYLAEKLQLDILPIMIHGNADRLPKKETLVNSGNITIKYLDKIAWNDPKYGSTYSERTKAILKYFREEFEKFKVPLEKPDYFKNKLMLSYLYKGHALQKEIKQEYQSYKNIYHIITELIPKDSRILHIGSGYGVMDLLLVYDQPQRKITAYEREENKRNIFENCYSVKRYSIQIIDKIPENRSFDTLIHTDEENLNEMEIPDTVNYLVVYNKENRKFPSAGFEVLYEEKGFTVLRRE